MSKILLSGIICIATLAIAEAGELFGCDISFPDQEERAKRVQECSDKHKYPVKMTPTLDDLKDEMKALKEKNFEDGCYTKCFYEQANLVEKDGKVAVGKFEEFYKGSNATGEFVAEVKSIFEACVKETEPKFKEKEISCKMYAMVDACLVTRAMENKAKLEKVCQKA